MELVETVSNSHWAARVSLSIRFVNCSSPARTRSALMNGYSFRKASSSGFEVSMAIEVYQTTLPSFLAPSMSADCAPTCAGTKARERTSGESECNRNRIQPPVRTTVENRGWRMEDGDPRSSIFDLRLDCPWV